MEVEMEKYPEWISSDNPEIDNYDIEHVDVGTYEEDYEKAQEIASIKKGEVYTMIDGEGRDIVYEKGLHYVNRIGICVLKWIGGN